MEAGPIRSPCSPAPAGKWKGRYLFSRAAVPLTKQPERRCKWARPSVSKPSRPTSTSVWLITQMRLPMEMGCSVN
jgi:hypothetical protein